jgi:hypothetical protein
MLRTPRDIETKFKKRIGTITPYMSLIDIASQEFAKQNSIDELTTLVRGYGHKKLSVTSLELTKMAVYINISHIAFINSRADGFCDDVKQFNKTLSLDGKSYGIESVDKLRKTIFLVHARKANIKVTETTLNEKTYQMYVGKTELMVVEYYRNLRNVEFHGGLESSDKQVQLSTEDLNSINEVYKWKPSKFTEISVRDAILYSQVWQQIAINLCRNLVEIDSEFIKELCEKYRTSSESRRNNAISQKLQQDYLQPIDFVDSMRFETNGWMA